MQVKEAIAGLRQRMVVLPQIPDTPLTLVEAERIDPPGFEVKSITPFDLDRIAQRLASAFERGNDPGRRDLKHAASCIWQGTHPWTDRPHILARFLDHVRMRRRRSDFRRLASAYLIAFPAVVPHHRSVRDVAAALGDLVGEITGPLRKAAETLNLFDPDKAPGTVARLALTQGKSPSALLAAHGVRNVATETGLAEAAFLAGLAEIRSNLNLPVEERLRLVKAWGLRSTGELLFEQHRGPLADALVLPAVGTASKHEIDRILDFLIRQFGDPRLRAARWQPMQRETTETIRRWLTSLSLRQFLDVVDQGAYDYQWRFRRAFWEAVHRRELIADAWVIFDEIGDTAARKLFEVKAPYARWAFTGRKQIQKGHAVLLLRIGRGVVAEWSHNGRCNIWHDAEDPSAPKLNRPAYNSDEVRIGLSRGQVPPRVEITHAGSESYSWQARVANEIYALTNVRVLEVEYRVPK